MFSLKQWGGVLGLSVMLSVPISIFTMHLIQPAKPMVTFDLKGATKRYSHHLANNPTALPDALIAHKIDQYTQLIESELSRYAKEHKAVIFVDNAIFRGAQDITPFIEKKVIDKINPS